MVVPDGTPGRFLAGVGEPQREAIRNGCSTTSRSPAEGPITPHRARLVRDGVLIEDDLKILFPADDGSATVREAAAAS